MPKLVYSRHYDITFFGVERTHPFDSRKYGRAWAELRRRVGPSLLEHWIKVDRPIRDEELSSSHSPGYLKSLRRSRTIAESLELPFLAWFPAWVLRWRVLRPTRYAVRGTVLAATAALREGVAINLSGGYHHAKPDRGEGFCLFSDAAVAVRQLRAAGLIGPAERVVYIDLDAHQGNGVCHQFLDDRQVFIFDMYNAELYPREDRLARERIDCDVPLLSLCSGAEYLRLLKGRLPLFLDSVAQSEKVALAIYNAGTDVFVDDPLGRLGLSPADVLARDLFVVGELRRREIPVVVVPSGGYTRESYRLIAATIERLLMNPGL